MPHYDSLRLSTGGGIISKIQKSMQAPNTATIVIGCGGTGKNGVKQVKKSLYERVNPDDSEASVPKYSHVKFIVIDSDKAQLTNTGVNRYADLAGEELFSISSNANAKAIMDELAAEVANGHAIAGNEWLNIEGIRRSKASCSSGAGGIRQLGRYLVIRKMNQIRRAIKSAIDNAILSLVTPEVQIFILTGVGGGTGSGIFLDICYLVKDICTSYLNTRTSLIAFMPDVTLANGELPPAAEPYIERNGYCALRELEYCMNDDSKWTLENPKKDITGQPADLVVLVTATDSGGTLHGEDYAYNVSADFILDCICGGKNAIADGNANDEAAPADEKFGLKSFISNFSNLIAPAQMASKNGAHFEYCILGAASTEVPFRKILTYLASKLFCDYFTNVSENKPTVEACKDFAKKVCLNSADGASKPQLYQELVSGEEAYKYVEPDFKECEDEFKAHSNSPLIDHIHNLQANKESKWKENQDNLTKGMVNYGLNAETQENQKNAKSVITRVYANLIEILLDETKGPYYAHHLINGTQAESLVHTVRSFGTWAESQKNSSAVNILTRKRNEERTKEEFFKAGKLTVKSKYENYAAAHIAYYELLDDLGYNGQFDKYAKGRLDRFSETAEMIAKQLEALDKEILALCAILTELQAVFKANYADLQAGKTDEFIDGNYVSELFSITDDIVKKDMDHIINKNLNPHDEFRKLMECLLNCHERWNNDNEVAHIVSGRFLEVFKDYANRGMEHYLYKHYNIPEGDIVALESALQSGAGGKKGVLEELHTKASPLFYCPADCIDMAANNGYISIPSISTPLKNATSSYLATHRMANPSTSGFTQRKSSIRDRIQVFLFSCGVPLYQYTPLDTYKQKYFNGKDIFFGNYSHENEKLDVDWGKILPYPKPASKQEMQQDDNDDTKEAKRLLRLFNKAMSYNVLTSGRFDGNPSHYNEQLALHYIDYDMLYSEVSEIQEKLHTNIITIDEALHELDNIEQKINKQKMSPPTDLSDPIEATRTFVFAQRKEPEEIATAGADGHKQEIRFDNFVRYFEFREKALKELQMFEEYEDKLKKLRSEIETECHQKYLWNTFCRTAFCDMFDIEDDAYRVISFKTLDAYGNESDPYNLSGLGDKFSGIGIYQAYLKFVNLEETVISNAAERTKELFEPVDNDLTPLKKTIWKVHTTLLSDEQVKKYHVQRFNNKNFTETEKKEIKQFLDDLVRELKDIIEFHIGGEILPDREKWTCTCGAMNIGKFCTECGKPLMTVQKKEWTCACGTVNTGKFCTECGKPPITVQKKEWTCACGTVNTGKFCTECGKPPMTVQKKEWTCACGTANTGKFCTECGKPPMTVQKKEWTCICGTVNIGKFCTECAKPKTVSED